MKTIIVAGITRSGLTMTMQMLNAGGFPCYGEYPSFEVSETIPYSELQGKNIAIKAIDTHCQIPPKGEYYVIRLRRDFKQQLKSQKKFLNVLGIPTFGFDLTKMKSSLKKDYFKIDNWAKKQKKFMYLDFESVLENPKDAAQKLSFFLNQRLDTDAMEKVVVKRSSQCYEGMLELEMISSLKNEAKSPF